MYVLYDRVSLPKWHSRHHSTAQHPTFTTHNTSLSAYDNYHATKYPANSDSSLLHLRVTGVQPYLLTKLNFDSRTGKCDSTQSEAIELLPYQTFDIIMPLPSRMLIPHISQDPSRVTVAGSVTNAGGRDTPQPRQTERTEQHRQHKQHKQPTNPSQLHPCPPRPNTLSQLGPNVPPELPAFPILQVRHTKPSTHTAQEQQPDQEPSTEESSLLHNQRKRGPPAHGSG